MSELLGHLVWWKVGPVDLTHETLASVLKGTGASVPARPIPVDVFRRVGHETKSYEVGESTLECSTAAVESHNEAMLLRHIVGTVRSNGVVRWVGKLGDVAFYKPPRGQHSKARIRVLAAPGDYAGQAEDFAQHLRDTYQAGARGAVDSQAIRRVVRTYLADHGAVYLDGPYFIENAIQCEALGPLFEALGKDSLMHSVPLVDTPEQRAFLAARRQGASA